MNEQEIKKAVEKLCDLKQQQQYQSLSSNLNLAGASPMKNESNQSFDIPPFLLNPQFIQVYVDKVLKGELPSDTKAPQIYQTVLEDLKQIDLINESIKLQIWISSRSLQAAEELKKVKKSEEKIITPIQDQIMEIKTKSMPGFHSIYQKIQQYCIIRCRMGTESDLAVVKETEAALNSFFGQDELQTYVTLYDHEKEKQLQKFVFLTGGIRLFNKSLNKGGAGIRDLKTIGKKELQDVSEWLHKQKKATLHDIDQLQIAFLKSLGKSKVNEELKQNLNYQHHILQAINIMIKEEKEKHDQFQQLFKDYEDVLKQLRFQCRNKTSLPIEQIEPLFKKLVEKWWSIQDLFFNIENLSQSIPLFNHFINLANHHFQNLELNQANSVLSPILNTDYMFENVALDLLKKYKVLFTPFQKLQQQQQPNSKLVQYQQKFFVFYDKVPKEEEMEQFLNDLNSELCQDLAMRLFFKLQAPKNSSDIQNQTTEAELEGIKARTIATQTETEDLLAATELLPFQLEYLSVLHPYHHGPTKDIEKLSIQKGMPSEWKLRQDALKLLKLRHSKSLGTQTQGKSGFRRDNATMCWVHGKQSSTQTKKDTKVGTEHVTSVLVGIRGEAVTKGWAKFSFE